ncbi:MAG: energy-coupling factor transporter ATPase [Armatimonadetes bacterium]|nr:energy-coupling factor transporter ATPase [Armatimonadota bacterium]
MPGSVKYNNQEIIRVEGLTHVYAAGTPLAAAALRDVSLSVKKGEFLVLAGPTGSGKSTLAQHFNGLLLPTAGIVRVAGRDTREKNFRRRLWQLVGLAFQYPEQQLFAETVFDDVAFGPRNLRLAAEEVEKRAAAALEMVGLDPREAKERSPFALSQGQRRRAALAGILAIDPAVLVLDEPAAGLDPRGRRRLLGVFKDLQQRRGKTIVLITHDMDNAALLADRIVILKEGRIFREGTPREVFGDPGPLLEIGLRLPVPAEILRRLGIKGVALTLPEAEERINEAAAEIRKRWPDFR